VLQVLRAASMEVPVAMAHIEQTAKFLTPLKYEEIAGTKYIRLLDDFVVYSFYLKRTIIVPKGFVCDGESVFFKSSTEAGVVHDYLYRSDSVTWDISRMTYKKLTGANRREADAVFEEMSRLDKAGYVMSWLKWAAVRVFAHGCWHKHNVMDDVSKEY
jgi:hypothetical protein